jgi:hypothetical protein
LHHQGRVPIDLQIMSEGLSTCWIQSRRIDSNQIASAGAM